MTEEAPSEEALIDRKEDTPSDLVHFTKMIQQPLLELQYVGIQSTNTQAKRLKSHSVLCQFSHYSQWNPGRDSAYLKVGDLIPGELNCAAGVLLFIDQFLTTFNYNGGKTLSVIINIQKKVSVSL